MLTYFPQFPHCSHLNSLLSRHFWTAEWPAGATNIRCGGIRRCPTPELVQWVREKNVSGILDSEPKIKWGEDDCWIQNQLVDPTDSDPTDSEPTFGSNGCHWSRNQQRCRKICRKLGERILVQHWFSCRKILVHTSAEFGSNGRCLRKILAGNYSTAGHHHQVEKQTEVVNNIPITEEQLFLVARARSKQRKWDEISIANTTTSCLRKIVRQQFIGWVLFWLDHLSGY